MTIMMVTFGYDAQVVPYRAQRETRTRLRGEVPVNVADLSDDLAPIVATFEREGKNLSIRWDGQSFYKPQLSPTGEEIDPAGFEQFAMGVGMREHGSPMWSSYPFPRYKHGQGTNVHYENVFKLDTRESSRPRRWVSDTHDQMAAKTAETAQDLAVIDGIMHRRCREPRWRLSLDRKTITLWTAELKEPKTDIIDVRLDRLDLAKALVSALPGFTGLKVDPNVSMSMPHAFALDEASALEATLFTAITNDIAKTVARSANLQSIREWLHLRELADAFRDGRQGLLADGFEALRRYLAAGDELLPGSPTYDRACAEYLRAHLAVFDAVLAPAYDPDEAALAIC